MWTINICHRCGNAVKGKTGKVVFCEKCFAGIRIKEEKNNKVYVCTGILCHRGQT